MTVVAVAPQISPQSPPGTRTKKALLLYSHGFTTRRIAEVTGYTRRRVTAITRRFVIDAVKNAGVEELRLKLFVDLEEVKALVQESLLYDDDLSSREREQQTNSLIKVVHEQALLIGAHSPKQIAVTSAAPPENDQARAYAKDVVRFMELSEKMAAVGPSRTQLSTEDTDGLIESDVVEPSKPELLRRYEEEYEERAPSSVPVNFD